MGKHKPPDLVRDWSPDGGWLVLIGRVGVSPYKIRLAAADVCPECERKAVRDREDFLAFSCPDCSHFVHRCADGHEWTVTIPIGWKQLDEREAMRA